MKNDPKTNRGVLKGPYLNSAGEPIRKLFVKWRVDYVSSHSLLTQFGIWQRIFRSITNTREYFIVDGVDKSQEFCDHLATFSTVYKEKVGKTFIKINTEEDFITLTFNIGHDTVMEVGNKMEEINSSAYMNGYNWEIFIDYYFTKHDPKVLEEISTDSESGMYVAMYPTNDVNRKKANKLRRVMNKLIKEKTELYRIVKEEDINWE